MSQNTNGGDPNLDAILKQYESNTNTTTTTKSNQKGFDLKNYFSTYIPEKVKEATKRVRILPAPNGGTPFTEIWVHTKEVDGQKRKFPCIKNHEGIDCPFCDARKELLNSGLPEDKELAKKYSARKMYVLRVIDRDNEDEGIKFWRFNHDYRNQGIYDKIMGIIKNKRTDISNSQTGRDIFIDIKRDQNKIPVVASITDNDPSPIFEDSSRIDEIMSDERTWKDVYAMKPYDFLEIVVKGGVPVWDKVNNGYIDKEELEERDNSTNNHSMDMNSLNGDLSGNDFESKPQQKPAPKMETTVSDDDDELPF